MLEERLVSVVVPCWNEEANVDFMVSGLRQVAFDEGMSMRVVFVDDCSDDSTWKLVQTACQRSSQTAQGSFRVEGIRLERHSGKNVAQAIGLRHCRGSELVIFMDGDRQHPISSIPTLVHEAEETGDPVVASRSGYSRQLMTSAGVALLRLAMKLLGIPFSPDLSEYLALPRASVEFLAGSQRLGVTPLLDLVQTTLGSYSTVSVTVEPRASGSGRSRWTLTELWRKALLQLLADPWRLLPRMTLIAVLAFLLLLGMASVSALHATLEGTSPGTVAILLSVVVLAAISVGMWVVSIVVSVVTLRLLDSQVDSVSYEVIPQ